MLTPKNVILNALLDHFEICNIFLSFSCVGASFFSGFFVIIECAKKKEEKKAGNHDLLLMLSLENLLIANKDNRDNANHATFFSSFFLIQFC